MNYYKDCVEEYDDIEERYELMIDRIRQIPEENIVPPSYQDYFACTAQFILMIDKVVQKCKEGELDSLGMDELASMNKELYADITGDAYNSSYANYEYSYNVMKKNADIEDIEEISRLLTFLYNEIRGMIVYAFEGRLVDITLFAELYVQIYFMCQEQANAKQIKEAIYYFENDYAEYFMTHRIREQLDPVLTFATDIVMNSDLSDLSYLYRYGEYIGYNEIKTAEFLNTLPQKEIDSMASTYTKGFREGYMAARIDMSKKKTVNIRYSIGQERMVRAAIEQFRDMGLEPLCFRYAVNRINRRLIHRIGYTSTVPNKQLEYDHRMDEALFLDKKLMERKLEILKQAYKKYEYQAMVYAGPACIEIFGENPFEPENSKYVPVLSEKQQEITVAYANASSQIVNEYIPRDKYSFTIIAYPMPEIGDNYEEIFREIVKINTLDNNLYRKIHQYIIDELDKAEKVRVVGQNGNKTDITVMMHELKNPIKETNFENCVADVNIPVGEVFTSPKLTGTQGVLNVSEVFLNDLKYTDLTLTFRDGKIADYTCKNFESDEENRSFVKENLLMGRDTLPIGEFAIGTNTTAYVIANKYDIVYKLPILIVEKMGPHFAVGDTCYSWSEENILYNPDGKEIVAKENECSVLRNTDIS
ncbi:MAG: aminopeptidase, partial [Coprococcus sp.]